MTAKATAIEIIQKLPDDTSMDQIIEDLVLKQTLDDRIRELDEEGGIPHEEVVQRLAQWLE